MAVYKLGNGIPILLGQQIGGGGEGIVYEVPGLPQSVAKIWKDPDSDRIRKMRILLRHTPQIPDRARNRIDLAWPTEAIYDADNVIVGYLMPKVSIGEYRELVNYSFIKSRRPIEEERGVEFSFEDILNIARNIAGVFYRLHREGYLVGDVNRRNFLVNPDGRVFVIDVDSFQARDPDTGQIHRCAVGTDDFTPPELVGQSFREVDRSQNHDLFGLAVLIFELLLNGVHPYDPIDQTGSQGSGQVRLDNIKRGHSPYANLNTVQALAMRNLGYIPDIEVRNSQREMFDSRDGVGCYSRLRQYLAFAIGTLVGFAS